MSEPDDYTRGYLECDEAITYKLLGHKDYSQGNTDWDKGWNARQDEEKSKGGEIIENGRVEGIELAGLLGLSESSADSYSRGKTGSSMMDKDDDLSSHLNGVKRKIIKKANNKLHKSLNGITDDKLGKTTAKDLSVIAKNMASIITMTEDKTDKDERPNVHFTFMAPVIKSEKDYEVIDMRNE